MDTKKNRYEEYERVRVIGDDPGLSEIHGQVGAILGYVQDDDETWYYTVSIYSTGVCWQLPESFLESIGEFDAHDSFYDGTSIRVQVDEKGRGSIRNPDH